MRRLFIIFLFAFVGCLLNAAPTIEVSLLTCEPGPAIYEHYGHTALRVRKSDDLQFPPLDIVFNYGCFDFEEDGFVMRFVLGQTDYLLGVVEYCFFEREYMEQSRRVWEQKLYLTEDEARRLADTLIKNAQPENRTYRYNFLYNNCTTKCRDIIEQCVNGSVHWRQDGRHMSLRDIMHQYNHYYPWASIGIDLLLGGSIDRDSNQRDRMFAPMYMMQYLDGATVRRADGVRQLAGSAVAIVNPAAPYVAHEDSSMALALIAAMAIGLVAAACVVKRRFDIVRGMIAAVLAAVGVLGIVPTFLFFFSEHPSVDSNMLVLVFNPLPLVLLLVRNRRFAIYLNMACLLMAELAYFGGIIYGKLRDIGHPVILQSVPSVVGWLILLYSVALIGYMVLGIIDFIAREK